MAASVDGEGCCRWSALPAIAALLVTCVAAEARGDSPPGAAPPSSPAPQPASAPEEPAPASARPLSLLLRLGAEFGGDDLFQIMSSDSKSTTITAGGRLALSAGLFFHGQLPFTVEATVGYKFDNREYSNGSIEFTRVPIDVIASGRLYGLRAGVGVTMHLAPSLSCKVTDLCTGAISFDTALGGILQFAYSFNQGGNGSLDIGIRFTSITYKARMVRSNATSTELDGSCTGLFIGLWF